MTYRIYFSVLIADMAELYGWIQYNVQTHTIRDSFEK